MKYSKIMLALIGAYPMLAVPESGGSTPVPGSDKVNQDLKAGSTELAAGASAKAQGLAAAMKFTEADRNKRETIIAAAEKFAKIDTTSEEGELVLEAREFLEGFAEGFSHPDTARNRKKEARAVFEAFCVPEYTRVVGLEEVKGADGKIEKQPKKETKPGSEWLKNAPSMGWNAFYAFAADIRGVKGAARGERLPKNYSADNHKTVAKWMKVASPEMASRVIESALDGMATQLKAKPGAYEQMLVLEIEDACGRLAKSSDMHYQKLAQTLAKIVTDDITERAKRDATAKTGLTDTAVIQAPPMAIPAAKEVAG